MQQQSDAAGTYVTDDRRRADVVLEHPQHVARDQRLHLRQHSELKRLDSICARRSQRLRDIRVHRLERVAEELSLKLPDAVKTSGR